MNKRLWILIVATILIFSASLGAETSRQLLPGQALANGAGGTRWLSELWISNPASVDRAAEISFWVQGVDNTSVAVAQTVIIPARSFFFQDDVLSWLSLPDPSVGVIVIDHEVDVDSEEPHLVAGSRTYNLSTDGTFGQFIQGVTPRTGDLDLTLPGAVRSAGFRSNLGLVNSSATDITALVSMAGTSRQVSVPAASQIQLNDIFGWIGAADGAETILISGAPGLDAYLSIIDNRTGDPTYLPPLEAIRDGFLSGFARASGVAGTQWFSDLVLANPGTLDREVDLGWLPNGTDNSTVSILSTRTLAPGETLILADVVGTELEQSSVAGTVTFSSADPILAWGRTYNQAGTGGDAATFGQTILPIAFEDMSSAGARSLSLFSRGNASFRTNLFGFNPSSAEATMTVIAADSDGVELARLDQTLQPRSGHQIGNVLSALGLDEETVSLYLEVDATASGYLSMIDNFSGDGITVSPVQTAATFEIDVISPAGDRAIPLGGSVDFAATTSGGVLPASGQWTCSPGCSLAPEGGTATFSASGTYVATWTAQDSGGRELSADRTISVSASSLAVAIDAPASTLTINSNVDIDFEISATGGTPPYTFTWDFDDGQSGSGAATVHAFSSTGSYRVTGVVTDSLLQSDSDSVTVEVVDPPPPPPPP